MKGEWTSKKKHGLANEMPDDFIILHASDVDSHKRKVTKFNSVQHWCLKEDICPTHFTECKQEEGCLPKTFTDLLSSDAAVAKKAASDKK